MGQKKMANLWRGSERRKTVRISTSIKVRYKVVGRPQAQYPSLGRDISGRGLGMLMDERMEEGQDLELEPEDEGRLIEAIYGPV